jgi:hypothetical protein
MGEVLKCYNGCTFRRPFFFHRFIENLIEFYPEIYEGPDGDVSPIELNFGKKWKSYTSIYQLAEGDIGKFDSVVSEPLEKCLLFLCYKADKNRIETLLHREAMNRASKGR